ncbi:hypothetical protein [Streptomyces sp. NPDC058653]|uniref:hypothetical protein n=1 Tax=Streptomyces sp. NPDC058653 TaxID=3346576 RepID=UPI003651865C
MRVPFPPLHHLPLLDCLITACDSDDRLGEEELASLAVLLLEPGHETTRNFPGNATLSLRQHSAELDRIRQNPNCIPAALDELFGFSSPISTAASGTPTKTHHTRRH